MRHFSEPKSYQLNTKQLVIITKGAPRGIRIPAAALKGLCPRPLDDGGKQRLNFREKFKLSYHKHFKAT